MAPHDKAKRRVLLIVVLVLTSTVGSLFSQQVSVAERAAMLKATIAASQAVLRQYQWVETTVISVNGEEKSRKQERCYYGADGALQKLELSETAAPAPSWGLRARIAERKREELTDYMKSAVALLKTYVPPSPSQLQAVKDAGGVSLDVLDPGKRVRLNYSNYQKAGDNLAIQIDLSSNRPLEISVSSYLNDPTDTLSLNVRMGVLDDGTTYPSLATLSAPVKNLTITVQNSGYQKRSDASGGL